MTDAPKAPGTCATCTTVDRKGYCAPGRCYCGHDTCPAFASYVDLAAIPLPDQTMRRAAKGKRSSWDTREESTWIDQL